MKRLILMRHAKSDWSGGVSSDHDRILSARGRNSAAALGAWMAQRGFLPDQVLCSSAARTRETYDRLALPDAPEPTFLRTLYLADAERIMTILRGATGDTVLVLGHNPGIGDMAERSVSEIPEKDAFLRYPTGATLVADFDVESWKDVDWHKGRAIEFIVPRELAPSS